MRTYIQSVSKMQFSNVKICGTYSCHCFERLMNAEDGLEGQEIFLGLELRVYYRMLWTNLAMFNGFVKKEINCFDVRSLNMIFSYTLSKEVLETRFLEPCISQDWFILLTVRFDYTVFSFYHCRIRLTIISWLLLGPSSSVCFLMIAQSSSGKSISWHYIEWTHVRYCAVLLRALPISEYVW